MDDTRKDYGPTGCVNRSFMLMAMLGALVALILSAPVPEGGPGEG